MIPYKNSWYQLNIDIAIMTTYRKKCYLMWLKTLILNISHYKTLAFYPNIKIFNFSSSSPCTGRPKKLRFNVNYHSSITIGCSNSHSISWTWIWYAWDIRTKIKIVSSYINIEAICLCSIYNEKIQVQFNSGHFVMTRNTL